MLKRLVSVIYETLLNLLIPLVYLFYIIIVLKTGTWISARHFTLKEILASLGLVGGLLLWGISYLYISPTAYLYPQADKLVTNGPYRWLRHPIYVGATLAFLGLSYLSHSQPALWYVGLVIIPINIGRALWEEKILLEIFGKQYRQYRKKTLF